MHRSLRARLFGEDEVLLLAGRYLLRERIGTGGMGVEHRARDRELDRDVAIKLVVRANPRMIASPQALPRVEAWLARSRDSPG